MIIGVDKESLYGTTCLVLPWMSYGNVLEYIASVGWFSQDAIRLVSPLKIVERILINLG